MNTWVYVYRHPQLQLHQFFRFGPYEDGEAAYAVGMLLFGPPAVRGFDRPVGWYTSARNTSLLSHREQVEFVPVSQEQST